MPSVCLLIVGNQSAFESEPYFDCLISCLKVLMTSDPGSNLDISHLMALIVKLDGEEKYQVSNQL